MSNFLLILLLSTLFVGALTQGGDVSARVETKGIGPMQKDRLNDLQKAIVEELKHKLSRYTFSSELRVEISEILDDSDPASVALITAAVLISKLY